MRSRLHGLLWLTNNEFLVISYSLLVGQRLVQFEMRAARVTVIRKTKVAAIFCTLITILVKAGFNFPFPSAKKPLIDVAVQ